MGLRLRFDLPQGVMINIRASRLDLTDEQVIAMLQSGDPISRASLEEEAVRKCMWLAGTKRGELWEC